MEKMRRMRRAVINVLGEKILEDEFFDPIQMKDVMHEITTVHDEENYGVNFNIRWNGELLLVVTMYRKRSDERLFHVHLSSPNADCQYRDSNRHTMVIYDYIMFITKLYITEKTSFVNKYGQRFRKMVA